MKFRLSDEARVHELTFTGSFLRRGFWLYAWVIIAADHQVYVYVGRTGDSSSLNAQSPFSRMSLIWVLIVAQTHLARHLQSAI